MPQALPLAQTTPGLDVRPAELRPRAADATARAENRQAFHRMLDRMARPDAAGDVRREPAKEPVRDTAKDGPADQVADADNDQRGSDAAPEHHQPAETAAAAEMPALPMAPAAVPAEGDADLVAMLPVPVDPAALMPSLAAEAVQAAPIQAGAEAAVAPVAVVVAATPLTPEPAQTTDAPPVLPTLSVDRPAPLVPGQVQTAAVEHNSVAETASKGRAGPEIFALTNLQIDRQIDPDAAEAAVEAAVSTVQTRQGAKAKGGSADGMADITALTAVRDERGGNPRGGEATAVAFTPDTPKSAAALYNRIAEAAKTADAPAPAEQLSMRLIHAAAEGKRAIQVHLHPAELGAIDVKMQWQGDKMTAQFVVDRPETLQLLQRDLPALERGLGQAGVNVDSGSLQFSLRQQQSQNQGQSEGRDSAPARAAQLDRPAADAIQDQLGQVVREGLLSIRV